MRYLYKGLREEEIKLKQLIPKEQGIFMQHPKLPITFPINLGKTRENAARNHQKEKGAGDYKTSGVSTSTKIKIARKYATDEGKKNGFVAYILRNKLPHYKLKEYDVNNQCPEVLKPDDCEIILYDDAGKPMPKDIIEKIILTNDIIDI